MRKLFLFISVLLCLSSEAQIIRANAYYRPFAAGGNLLFDTYDATVGYSLRKLKTSYSGSAIRVRESGGNTETDIGFLSSGELDTVALKNHCGSNSGFITKWYNQGSGGSSLDAVQTTSSIQPRIVDAGVVERSNGKPSGRYVNGSGYRLTASSVNIAQPLTVFSVAELTAATGINASTLFHGTSANFIFFNRGTSESPINNISLFVGSDNSLGSATVNQNLYSIIANTTSSNVYRNGSAFGGTLSLSNNNLNGLLIGTFNSLPTTYDWSGWISELIIYSSNQSSNRTAIESNINTFYSTY